MSFGLVKAGCKPNEFHSPWQRLGDLIMHALKGQQRPALSLQMEAAKRS